MNLCRDLPIIRSVFTSLALFACALPPSPVRGVNTQWSINADGGFTSPVNWNNGVPGSDDRAVFRRGEVVSYTVSFPGNSTYVTDQLRVGSNDVTFVSTDANYMVDNPATNEPDRAIVVANQAADIATLTTMMPVSAAAVTIGDAAMASGTLHVASDVLTITGDSVGDHELIIGNLGAGALNVTGGAEVHVDNDNGSVVLGSKINSSGIATVRGAGSLLSQSQLIIGDAGDGVLRIEAGGRVDSLNSVLGAQATSSGAVTIEGPESHFAMGDLSLAGPGDGSFTLAAGGSALSAAARIRGGGIATVTGDGSNWDAGTLSVGGGSGARIARLAIEAGGSVSSVVGQLGTSAGPAVVSVAGPDTTWAVMNGLQVGFQGDAELSITAGGGVASGHASLGVGFTSTAVVTVAGAGSSWSVDSRLALGGNATTGLAGGDGTLTIQAGGAVSVGQDAILFPDGLLILEGGSFTASDIVLEGGHFEWTSGVLGVRTYPQSLLNVGGTLARGASSGPITVLGDYTQQAAGKLAIGIGGTDAGFTYDSVSVSGDADIDGALEVRLTHGFMPDPEDRFIVLEASNISGTFSNVTPGPRLNTIDGLGSFRIEYPMLPSGDEQIVLTDFQPSLTADFDDDGDVDGDDLAQWVGDFDVNGLSDADGDGDSDGADFLAWQRQAGSPPARVAAAAVPEPAACALALAASLAAAAVRRRSRSTKSV